MKSLIIKKSFFHFNYFNYTLLFFLFLFLSLFLSSCTSGLKKETLTIKKADGSILSVVAEIADTLESRQKGLMHRKSVPEGSGMLFIFEQDQILNFWMKDTPTPLSIAYITNKGEICDILDMTPFSLADITSTHYARYALEVPKGWFLKNGIQVGDLVMISKGQKSKD